MADLQPEDLWQRTLERERVPRLLADLKVASNVFSYTLRVAWRLQPDGINRELRFRAENGAGAIVTQKRSYAGAHAQPVTTFDGSTPRRTAWYEHAALPIPAVRLTDLLQQHPDDYDVTEADPVQMPRVLELRARGDRGRALIDVSIDPAGPIRTRARSTAAGTRELTYVSWMPVGPAVLATSWTVDEGDGVVWQVTFANVDTTSPLPNDLFRPIALDRRF